MPELLFIVPAQNADVLQRILSMLTFQKGASFRTCVVDLTGSESFNEIVAEFGQNIPVTAVHLAADGGLFWKSCLEAAPSSEWVCFLGPDVDFTEKSVKRMLKCIADHPAYDVFHWNLAEPFRKISLKTKPERLFTHVFVDGAEAPLSSFVFRVQTLREVFVTDPEAVGMDFALVLAAAKKNPVRTARWERIGYRKPDMVSDPALVEKEVRARLAFFRWTERFFGDDYPMGVGERLDLFARELARLYPSFTQDELKADLNTFAVVNGPIRRMRAASALKSALKTRQETLK